MHRRIRPLDIKIDVISESIHDVDIKELATSKGLLRTDGLETCVALAIERETNLLVHINSQTSPSSIAVCIDQTYCLVQEPITIHLYNYAVPKIYDDYCTSSQPAYWHQKSGFASKIVDDALRQLYTSYVTINHGLIDTSDVVLIGAGNAMTCIQNQTATLPKL